MDGRLDLAGQGPKGRGFVASPVENTFLLNRSAWVQRWRDRNASLEHAKRVLELQSRCESPNPEQRGLAFRTMAWQAKWRGNFVLANHYCVEGQSFLPAGRGHPALADILSILGVIHYSRRRLDLADEVVAAGLQRLDATTHVDTYVDLLTTRATVSRYRGQFARAQADLKIALEAADGADRARVLQNIARGLNHDQNYCEAANTAEESLAACRTHDNRVVLPYTLEILGASYAQLDRADLAEECFREGLAIAVADGDDRAHCQLLQEAGANELARGDPERALAQFIRGRELANLIDYPLWKEIFARRLAEAYEALGDYRKASEALKDALALKDQLRA